MLNWIFLILVGGSVLTAAFTGTMGQVTTDSMNAAKGAVDLAISLAGQMALWLGFMGVLREAGLLRSVSRGLERVMVRLFPDVPKDHPAMGAMIMNLAANMMGLTNAATPFGLKAMAELNKLNRHPGVSTNAMSLFLAINTSGVAVLPLGAVAMRAALGSKDAAGIIIPTLMATALSTVTAILVAKLLENRAVYAPERFVDQPHGVPAGGATRDDAAAGAGAAGPSAPPLPGPAPAVEDKNAKAMADAEKATMAVPPAKGARFWMEVLVFAAIAYALFRYYRQGLATQGGFEVTRGVLSQWLLPLLMLAIVIFAFGRKVKVYEVFVAAAKEGFQIAVMIIPFLVAILVAIAMFRASGAFKALVDVIGPFTSRIGFPAEAVPMALVRPLSGSGALATMTDAMKTYGPDSFIGYLVSVLNGSMETTFYVLAVYFGSVQIRAARHTLIACLSADLMGIVGATLACHLFFGGLAH